MNQDVVDAIAELRRGFPGATVQVVEDGSGGARVRVEPVDLSPRFDPRQTWMGGHLTSLYPSADIYPVFIGADVRRCDGKPFDIPITNGHNFMGLPALQVSRMNNQLHLARQTALSKFMKILHFLETLP